MIKRLFKYVLQSVAGMIGISVYILADTFFISVHSGSDGLAVLNLILPVYGLIYALGSMIGIGSATRYGIKKSSGENADFYFLQSLFWSLAVSIPFLLLGIFAPGQVLRVMGADQTLADMGSSYARIILTASPLFMMNYTFTAFARNDNATGVAMLGSLSGSLFNLVFDYIFMFPMNLGFAGAAFATACSPVVTMAVCSAHYFSKNNEVGFKWRTPSLHHIFSCCKLGVSAFVGEFSSAVTTTVFNMLILNLAGNTGVAAYGIVANISYVAMSIFNGISQGTQPLISESYGYGNQKQVRLLLKSGLGISVISELAILLGIWSATDFLIGIFNSGNNELLSYYAHDGLRLYFLGFLFAGINIMLVAYFSATDRAVPAIVGSVLRGAIAIILCSIVLSSLFGLSGVWLSFLASEAVTLIVIFMLSVRKS